MKVLLVEDDKFFSGQVVNMLHGAAQSKFEPTPMDTVRDAMDYLKHTTPDVIILDLNLPDSVGINTFIKIHQMAPDTPIIILSGEEDENQALRAVKIGAQDYLMKRDVRNVLLVRAINYAVQRRIERRQAESALRKYADELKSRNSALMDANQRLEQEIAQRNIIEQALRDSQEEISKLLINSPDIIYRLDSSGKIIYINKSPNNLSLEVIPGNEPKIFLSDDFFRLFKQKIEEVTNSGKTSSMEYSFIDDDKLYFARLIPLFRNEIVESVLVISSDVTERKSARDAVKELNKAKDNLLSIVNDEFANSTNKLMDIVKDLSNNFDSKTKIENKALINELEVTAETIKKLSDKLVSETGESFSFNEYKLSPGNVYDLIKKNLEIFDQQINSKKINVAIGLAPTTIVKFDEELLNSIFYNLIDFTVKHSETNSKIFVNLDSNSIVFSNLSLFKLKINSEILNQTQIDFINEKKYKSSSILNNVNIIDDSITKALEFVEKHGGEFIVYSSSEPVTILQFTLPNN